MSRRHRFLHPPAAVLILTLLLLGVWLQAGPVAAGDGKRPRPNVVFILVDDLGWADLGFSGSTFYETPNLDRLASESLRFTNAYTSCPVCSPTRASILTGKYPQRTGITDYIAPSGANQPEQWKRNTPLLPAPYSDRLAREELTLAEAFKEGGYATFFAGKWHLGPQGFWPEDQGFDINKGGIEQGGPYGGNKYFSPYGNPRLEDGPPGEHLTDRLATETARFIETNRNRPFFAYLSFYAVHTPLMARPDLQQKYADKKQTLRPAGPVFGKEGKSRVRLVQEHAIYAGMVEALDQAVGKVLDMLKKQGLDRNTAVVFTSDNGGLSTSEGHPTSNLPLRGGKGWLYEGGIRIPLLIKWPGVTQPGSVCEAPVTSPDFYPTLLQIAQLPARPSQHLDGVGLQPLLENRKAPDRKAIFWHYPHYGNQGGAPGGAIRSGNWKLIEWYEDQRVELFDLRTDPGEGKNLADQHPEVTAELRKMLLDWRRSVNGRMPAPNPRYRPDASAQTSE